MRRLGATAVPMPLNEVLPSLQRGVIDGTMSGTSVFVAFKFNDVVKVITVTNDTMLVSLAVVSKVWLDKLPPDLRKVVIDTGRATQVTHAQVGAGVHQEPGGQVERDGRSDSPAAAGGSRQDGRSAQERRRRRRRKTSRRCSNCCRRSARSRPSIERQRLGSRRSGSDTVPPRADAGTLSRDRRRCLAMPTECERHEALADAPRIILRDIPRAAIGVILLLAIAINFANIVGRYVFLAPLPWAEEVLGFLVIWGVCLGASAVTYDRRHLAMDLFSASFPPRLRAAIDALTLVAMVGFCGFTCIQAWKIVAIMARNGQVSITAGVPMTIPYAAFVAGFGLITVAADRRGGPTPLQSRRARCGATAPAAEVQVHAVDDAVPAARADGAGISVLSRAAGERDDRDRRVHVGAADRGAADHVRQHRQFRAAGGPVLHLRRRADGTRRHGAPADRVVMTLFGGFRGSMPITTVGAAALYGSISGSTAATVAALGPLFYPQLRKTGYNEKFSTGVITCAGYLDNIIPPSIAMILYCAAAEQSVIKLFAAGIVPGLVLAAIDVALHLLLRPHAERAGRPAVSVARVRGGAEGRRLGARSAGPHLRRTLRRHILADRGRRRRLRLRHRRHHGRSIARSAGASSGTYR